MFYYNGFYAYYKYFYVETVSIYAFWLYPSLEIKSSNNIFSSV